MARLPNAAALLTLEEAATEAGYLSPSTLRKAARDGRLKVIRRGARTILTTAEWVAAYGETVFGKGGRPRGCMQPAAPPTAATGARHQRSRIV